jgi:23S rRNA (adenine1618-N6)-methyltransferase
MMKESRQFASQCCWFSSLISKKEHVAELQSQLTSLGASRVKLVSMAQGQKQSRMLAWSFLDAEQLRQWRQDRW